MPVTSRRNHSSRSAGPTALPRTTSSAGSAVFDGLYMRPNLASDGGVPCGDPIGASPDIWIAGQAPIASYTTALASPDSYASDCDTSLSMEEQNFIYVRGRNGAASSMSTTVTLYYVPSGIISIPSLWQNNVIPTDQGAQNGVIAETAPGTVGVCSSTFVWSDPPSLPPGSGRYALVAQFNDAENSNPFPADAANFDLTSLIRGNLGWSLRDVALVPGTGATWQFAEPLAIPSVYPAQKYMIELTVSGGWVGWSVAFYTSETDSDGNPIQLPRTTIDAAGQTLGLNGVFLDPGWSALITVDAYSPDGSAPAVGWSMQLCCSVITTSADRLGPATATTIACFVAVVRGDR